MRVFSIRTLRDGPEPVLGPRAARTRGGLLRVGQDIDIKDRILRGAPQERIAKDAERYSLAFLSSLLATRKIA
jgi:hypothetical protein